MANAIYAKLDEKSFGVFIERLGEKMTLVGTTKLECDAQFHVHAINKALSQAHAEGYQAGINFVATGE